MDMKKKYIIIFDGDIKIPVIFDTWKNHIDVAREHCYQTEKVVISAGFVLLDEDINEIKAAGRSDSLGIPSHPNDTDIIKQWIISNDKVKDLPFII